MRNQLHAGPKVSEQKQAQRAIYQIQKWVEKHYPRLAGSAKTKMILECLIELTEEQKFLTAHG